jgi:hypothetical protein
MEKIGKHLPEILSPKDLRRSEVHSTDASQTRRALEATKAAEKLLSSYPDYGKAPKGYLIAIAEILAELSEEALAAVMDSKNGVRARHSFLPTVADIVKVAEEYIKKRYEFRPVLDRPTVFRQSQQRLASIAELKRLESAK